MAKHKKIKKNIKRNFFEILIILLAFLIINNQDKIKNLFNQNNNQNQNDYINTNNDLLKVHYLDVGQGDSIFIELPNNEFIKVKENIDILDSLNIKVEEFGSNSYRILSHPTWFTKGREKEIISKIFEDITNKGKDFSLAKFNDNLAKLVSCKMSIKANTRITKEAQEEIINKLRKCNNPFNCPHGRPTIIHFTTYEIERMFKRVV